MKKSAIKKILFIGLLVLSATCFSYLSLHGSETALLAQSLEYTGEMQASSMSDVNGMKNVVVKILKIMMLQF